MTSWTPLNLPSSRRDRVGLVFLVAVVILGGLGCGIQCRYYLQAALRKTGVAKPKPQRRRGDDVPVSKAPGLPRAKDLVFRLGPKNAVRMQGQDVPGKERWCDVAGNYYTRQFAATFSYEHDADDSPRILVRIQPEGVTLRGRIEAHNLKPNFAYQIKLFGDFDHRRSFERIGYTGRWRLPGWGTNYTDEDYEEFPEERKHEARAYIFFDYFVTDAHGNAARDIYLDSSLHVLWLRRQWYTGVTDTDLNEVTILASAPEVYARPKREPQTVAIWAERESCRYTHADQQIRLPPGDYKAVLGLTEESFHSYDTDGGYWATVAKVPVQFRILPTPE